MTGRRKNPYEGTQRLSKCSQVVVFEFVWSIGGSLIRTRSPSQDIQLYTRTVHSTEWDLSTRLFTVRSEVWRGSHPVLVATTVITKRETPHQLKGTDSFPGRGCPWGQDHGTVEDLSPPCSHLYERMLEIEEIHQIQRSVGFCLVF